MSKLINIPTIVSFTMAILAVVLLILLFPASASAETMDAAEKKPPVSRTVCDTLQPDSLSARVLKKLFLCRDLPKPVNPPREDPHDPERRQRILDAY